MKNEDGRMKRNRCQSSEGRCRVSGFKFQGIVSRYVILILFLCFGLRMGLMNAAAQTADVIVRDGIQTEAAAVDELQGTSAAEGEITAVTGTPEAKAAADGNGMEVLCLPGVYLIEPDFCNPLGPSEYLTDYVENGGVYPEPPFTGKKIDPALMEVPYQYARINADNSDIIYLYNSPEEAANSINPVGSISSGAIRYVSYTDVVDIGSGHYVHSKGRDLWLRASPAAVSTSTLGRTFTKTPEYDFGWIVEGCNPYLEADYNKGLNTTVYYNREDVVNCYETIETRDTTWFRIGENQWVDRIHFRAAHINTTPPPEIPSDRWIEVDLLEQVVMVYENYELIYACMVATGMKPYYTQPGIFQIYQKNESENMTGSFETDQSDYYWLEDVPFTMYFDKLRAFHGAYWRAWYGYEQSHGCVNMSNGDAHWLYNWANLGEWVYVHDPSGKTPTDPELYQEGGA